MSSSSELPPLFDEFPPVSTEAWMAKIREDLGASDPDAVLEWDSIDGISLPAFGRREDWAPLPHVSESASAPPLAGDASSDSGWRVRVDLRHPDLDAAAGLADLGYEGEVADLGLRLGTGAGSASTLSIDTPADLRTLLADVPLGETNLHLERGPGALVLLSLLRTAYDRPLSALLGRRASLCPPSGGALHGTVERLGPVRRVGVVVARFPGHGEDCLRLKPEIVVPAPDMLASRPALPPAGQRGGVEAQRSEQLFKKTI